MILVPFQEESKSVEIESPVKLHVQSVTLSHMMINFCKSLLLLLRALVVDQGQELLDDTGL